MGIQIGQKPSPTFQQPLELLSDCHRRIENFLRALVLVTEQAKGGALDERQRFDEDLGFLDGGHELALCRGADAGSTERSSL